MIASISSGYSCAQYRASIPDIECGHKTYGPSIPALFKANLVSDNTVCMFLSSSTISLYPYPNFSTTIILYSSLNNEYRDLKSRMGEHVPLPDKNTSVLEPLPST